MGDAVDDVGDGSAVRVDDVILLWRKVPSAKSEADYNGSKLHMDRLGANLGAVVKGDENGVVLLPVGALWDNCDSCVSLAVGGVTLFLEYVKEVVACVFPSAVYIDGVLGR